MSFALRIRYVHMFDKHGSRTTTEPMIIRLKICSHGQDKTDFFIFLFSQNFAQHCIMQNKPKGTGHPNVFDHQIKIKKNLKANDGKIYNVGNPSTGFCLT